jgi:hypothetical protein
MKVRILIICLLTSLFSCSKDEEPEIRDFNLKIEIRSGFIREAYDYDLLIHDSQGILIDKIKGLENSMNYELSISNEIVPIYLTIASRNEYSTKGYSIETVLIYKSTSIILGNYSNKNIKGENFKFDYEGFEIKDVITNSTFYSKWGTSLDLTPNFFPHDEVLSFNVIGQKNRKYVNIDNANPNETYSIGLSELINVKDSTMYSVSDNDFVYSVLYGRRLNTDKYYSRISQFVESKHPSVKHYLPKNEINDYLLWTEVDNNGIRSGNYKFYKEFDFSFAKPSIDYNIKEISRNKAKFSSSDGEYFRTRLLYNTGSDYTASWSIQGIIDNDIEFTLPKIDEYLLEIEENYIPGSLNVWSTRIYKTETTWNYNQFLLFSLEGILDYNIPSSIEYVSIKH